MHDVCICIWMYMHIFFLIYIIWYATFCSTQVAYISKKCTVHRVICSLLQMKCRLLIHVKVTDQVKFPPIGMKRSLLLLFHDAYWNNFVWTDSFKCTINNLRIYTKRLQKSDRRIENSIATNISLPYCYGINWGGDGVSKKEEMGKTVFNQEI